MENVVNAFKKIFDKKHRGRTVSYLIVFAAYILCEVMMLTGNMTSQIRNLLIPCCSYIVASLALNLCVGFSGELSLGHAGFLGVGAFSGAVISGLLVDTIPSGVVRLILAMLVAAALNALLGFLIGIPVLKLQGDYLAIVTLAFCQIIKSLINNIYLGYDNNGIQFSFVENKLALGEGAHTLISGPMGVTGSQRISNFTVGIVLIIIALVIIYNMMYSRNGRAIMAARDNRIAALSVGINVTDTKMLAFVISAALTGAAGALYGLSFSSLSPAKFDFNLSILILVYVVLGGLGNVTGTIIATVILYVLPEMLRSLQDYRMLIYAVILIAIMLITNNQKFIVLSNQFSEKMRNLFKKKGAENHE
ncbi:MAG: branched-chain amino acid ABC transporter permease [Erysipelotrichaceae bacterium]|nr:branched-chain amino acid ABC transporter permease [Erysipelotrichaceae bacterium]